MHHTFHHLRVSAVASLLAALTFSPPATLSAHERPNVLVILADDLGFSDIGCYGSEIDTPSLDALAAGGLRFTQFYNASRCCPTRASLLTGKYPHEVGLIRNGASLSQDAPTLAEIYAANGYRTAMAGKWHLTRAAALAGAHADSPEHLAVLNNQTRVEQFGDPATYPAARGFQQHYGVIWGIVNYFHPFALVENFEPVYDLPKDYYITDALNDRSAAMIRQFAEDDEPFFLYLAHTAPHWPLHAKAADRAKYAGRFDEGYEALRQRRYEKQLATGLIDPETHPLPTLDLGSRPPWNQLSDEQRRRDIAKMETHAAMIDCMDQGIGRVITALKETGEFENTLIVFLSDNGASPEQLDRPGYDRPSETPDGRAIRYTGHFPSSEMGDDDTWTGIGPAIANACNTPFRYWKKESWHGGNCTPAIVHWPAGLRTAGGAITTEVAHVIDLLPTFLQASQIPYPKSFRGHRLAPPRGISLMPLIRGEQREGHERLFFEHEGGAAMRQGDWKIVRLAPDRPWALYDLSTDNTETIDLAYEHLDRVREMHEAWGKWWVEVTGEQPPPWVAATSATPSISNRAIEIRASVEGQHLSGVVLAHGGDTLGYAVHFVDGRPTFDVRVNRQVTRIQSPESLAGRHDIVARLGAQRMTLEVDGTRVAAGPSPGLIPKQPIDGLSVARDDRTAAGDYSAPNAFTGEVLRYAVTVE